MKEITILKEAPVIFSKDEYWVKDIAPNIKLEPGAIVLLPEDAILLTPKIEQPPVTKGNKI